MNDPIDTYPEFLITSEVYNLIGQINSSTPLNMILPDLENLIQLHPRILLKWIDIDNKITNHFHNVIYTAATRNKSTEYIKWLVIQGFRTTQWDTAQFALNSNLELLQFYHQQNLPFDLYTANNAVKTGRLDILEWLYSVERVVNDNESKYLNGEKFLMETAFENNHKHILEYLKNRGCTFTKLSQYDESIYFNHKYSIQNGNITNDTLKWMWDNGYKWSLEEAKMCNSDYMLSGF